MIRSNRYCSVITFHINYLNAQLGGTDLEIGLENSFHFALASKKHSIKDRHHLWVDKRIEKLFEANKVKKQMDGGVLISEKVDLNQD